MVSISFLIIASLTLFQSHLIYAQSCGDGNPCPGNLDCVITSFGPPKTGQCTGVVPNEKCSVSLCTRTGRDTNCVLDGILTTCGAWADRIDGGPRPVCKAVCSTKCNKPQLLASDGSLYCNECLLRFVSCTLKFEVFGPIKLTTAPFPCFSRRCPPNTSNTVTDIANNQCRCLPISNNVAECNPTSCANSGASHTCKVQIRGRSRIVTCKAWAQAPKFVTPQLQCLFPCPAPPCQKGSDRPLGSNAVFYCNSCVMTMASCASDFMIRANIPHPGFE